jgi:hypothetical protein
MRPLIGAARLVFELALGLVLYALCLAIIVRHLIAARRGYWRGFVDRMQAGKPRQP